MKKVVAIVLVLALAGAAAWYFLVYKKGGAGATPGLAASLPAETTVALVGLADPVGWVKSAEESLKGLPPELNAELAALADPKQREQALGFDPGSPEGWKNIGVDPAGGVAMVIDAKVRRSNGDPTPLLVATVSDRAKLLDFLGKKTGTPITVGDKAGPSEIARAGAKQWLIGTRGGITALVETNEEAIKDVRPGFDAFLSASGPTLADDAAFKKAFDDARGALRGFAWFATRTFADLATARSKEDGEGATFFADLFPAGAAYISAEGSGARLVASEKGHQLLEQLLRPRKSAPHMAKYLPAENWAAARYSVNLVDVWDGIAGLLPPAVPAQMRAQLPMAKAMLPLMVGFTWEELTGALSGHVVIAADLSKLPAAEKDPSAMDWLVLVGVQEGDKADAFFDKMVKWAAGKIPAGDAKPVEVKGKKGWQISAGAMNAFLVRDDEVLLIAPTQAAIEAALGRAGGDNLSKKGPADALDGDVVFGAVVDIVPLLDAAAAQAQVKTLLETAPMKKLRDTRWLGGDVRLDSGGLSLHDGTGTALPPGAIVGGAAALAIPSFVKYQCRARTTEAAMYVSQIAHGASAYYANEQIAPDGTVLAHKFPPGASRTPGTPDCPGTAGFQPDVNQWSSGTWKELGFAPEMRHFYRYEFISEGEGPTARFTARAVGDLDCDGTFSTFERTGSVDANGEVVIGDLRREAECE